MMPKRRRTRPPICCVFETETAAYAFLSLFLLATFHGIEPMVGTVSVSRRPAPCMPPDQEPIVAARFMAGSAIRLAP
jgi:hypothetical protein